MRTLPILSVVLLAATVAAQPPARQVVSFLSPATGPVGVYEVADGLEHPWGLAFLPDGRMLVTERPGRLRIVDAGSGEVPVTVEGVPAVYAQGQGGLLDVALDPDFAENQYVYLTYARPGPNATAASALGRGRLVDDELQDFEVLFTVEPFLRSRGHFGSRIAFSASGHLFMTTGERFQFTPSQDLTNGLGAVLRLHRDGSIPDDNPFVRDPNAEGAIWSFGHRNIQSAAFHGRTGELFVAEMGPLGGDELNHVRRSGNYGWPHVSWGMDYDGELIPDPPTRPEFDDALHVFNPTIAPSGMAYYAGERFPGWRGSFFIGSLVYRSLIRVAVENGEVTSREIYPIGRRIREVEQGPDGLLYVLTDQDDGGVLVLRPIETRPAPENEFGE
ncbi:MAG: PQQ-dependent sugar dehydrogenase [Bacteroidota bacterium]